MSSRSNSASAAKMWKIRRPVLVVVSIPSCRDANATPRPTRALTVSTRCFSDRDKSQLIWWMVAQAEIARGAGRGGLRLLPREGGACGCRAGVRGGRVVSGLPVTPAVRGA